MTTLPLLFAIICAPAAQDKTVSSLAAYDVVDVAEVQIEEKAVQGFPLGLEDRLKTQIVAYLQNASGFVRVLDKMRTAGEPRQPAHPGAGPTVTLNVIIEDFHYKGDYRPLNMARVLAIALTGGGAMLCKPCRPDVVTSLLLRAVFRDSQTNYEIIALRHKEVLKFPEDSDLARETCALLVTDRAAAGLVELIEAHRRGLSAQMTSVRKQGY